MNTYTIRRRLAEDGMSEQDVEDLLEQQAGVCTDEYLERMAEQLNKETA